MFKKHNIKTYKIYFCTGSRSRLRGMSIQGLTQSDTVGFTITNYDPTGPSCTSDNAQLSGPSVCDDVILIPVNSGTDVQFVQISVKNNSLTLCEVQVFAGKRNIPVILTVCHSFLFKNYILLQIYEEM